MFSINNNNKITIQQDTFERINIHDEWNVNETCNSIIKYKYVMIRADLQGSGKSYVAQNMANMGWNVLFVCPTNKLSQSNHEVTINNFFRMTIHNDEMLSKTGTSKYDVIVFDELNFADIYKLTKIKHFVQHNPDKIIIATGDTAQLEPIHEYSNQTKYDEYADECINNIFPYDIYLHKNKRLTTDADKAKPKQSKQ